jgi:ATP-dependent protease ClpP protease subunit
VAGHPAAPNGKSARWFSIKNQADGPAVVSIHDEVGWFGVTAQDFIRDLADIPGDIELHLSTPGGDVFDGMAIFSALKQRSGTLTVVVDSLAASIGAVIAMAASPGQLAIAPSAVMMVHEVSGLCAGSAQDMRQEADLLDRFSQNISEVYADRTGKPASHWRAAMLAETWYFGQQAVDAGLADRMVGAASRAANHMWGPQHAAAFRAAFGARGGNTPNSL